jgi:hypothetical protein
MKLGSKIFGLLFLLASTGLVIFLYFNPSIFWQFRIQYLMADCSYSSPNCENDEYCVQFNHKQGKCFPKPKDMPEIIFPKGPESPNVCSQGILTPENRTHSYLNTGYAVDLSTSPGSSNADIRAVFDGEVVVNTGCDNKDDEKLNDDPCGQGFGNWVVIYENGSDFLAFYAHLRTVKVKSGDRVSKGQIIGEEGKTGRAGHRHLHFSIHKNIFGIRPSDMKKHGAWLPPSIPFRTTILDESGKPKEKNVMDLPCVDSNDLDRSPFYGAQ